MKDTAEKLVSRRRIVGLMVASLLVISGCARFRRDSDLEQAQNELRVLLEDIADSDAERAELVSIAQRIGTEVNALLSAQQIFLTSFDDQLNSYDVSEQQVMATVNSFTPQRVSMRNNLLGLQSELQAALTPDEWTAVLEVLNRKGAALSSSTSTLS